MNRKILNIIIPLFLLLTADYVKGNEPVNVSDIQNSQWTANWIEVPGEPKNAFGVYLFRKDFTLQDVPSSFIVNISADNRYKLFVNGKLASLGPARGDILNWRYETADISNFLLPGKNVIAAVVWNDGGSSPLAQISYRTGFILQGNSETEEIVNTNSTWKCLKDEGYRQISPGVIGYYAASPGESLDMNDHEMHWKENNYNDKSWKDAKEISPGNPKGVFTFNSGWMLVPSPIPAMEMKREPVLKIREAKGINLSGDFQIGNPLTVPANTHAELLLDQTYLTNAYPTIQFSGGKAASISVKYAEALYSEKKDTSTGHVLFYKTNRNDIKNKVFIGLKDSITSNGKDNQEFTSLWWRSYRYIKVTVYTENEPLTINDIYGTFTGYPYELKAKFESPDPVLDKILKVGWHTVRLCSFETYMDCPYYEQLQYIGDTRIQVLVSYFNSGDNRLAKNAITLLDESRIASGLTQSRYPSSSLQLIPPFSLWWIGMLHDYWMYNNDSGFVKSMLPGERQILSFFGRFQQKDGSIINLPYWDFTDWVQAWNHGVPPLSEDGTSSILDLQLLSAYQLASRMESRLGMHEYAELYSSKVLQLKAAVLNKYWDNSRKEFADNTDKNSFSQHANALAILTGVVSGNDAHSLGSKIISDTSLTQATIYFKYYVNRALIKAGYGDSYLNRLDIWKDNLDYGMSTFAEYSDLKSTRSDCHGWSASPDIEFYRTVLGIDSYSPGFQKIIIEPHLGTLKWASGEIPHPDGKISVSYKQEQTKWKISIALPDGTSGLLIWKGQKYNLEKGDNNLMLN